MGGEREAAAEVARLAAAHGGRALLVGGCVRDALLGRTPKDYDMEVFGLDAATLERLLGERFALDTVGKSFGVFKLHGLEIDVSLPRRETKLGLGHKAFGIETSGDLTLAEAAARRDFTVNAIYRDPLSGETLDPWGGRKDLERGILRHISGHFREDPLRVLRGMQFVARFGLHAAQETVGICRTMTPEGLAQERLFEEWRKLLTKGRKISRGLEFLRSTGWVRHYPELARLIGCRQDREWHPEGDAWAHTLCALDAFAEERDALNCGESEDMIVGLAVLCHDFGKPASSFFDRRKGRIRSPGHDEAGVEPTLSFLRRLTNEEAILKDVPPLVRTHMRPFSLFVNKSSESAVRRLAAEVKRIDRLVRVCRADERGRPPTKPDERALEWLAETAERLDVKAAAPKPILMGRDLIALGMKPGEEFGKILKRAYDAQLDGKIATKEDAIAFARGAARPIYILWDWNGTLLDDTQAALDTLNTMLSRRGAKTIGMDFYLDHFSFPVRPFYEAIGMVLENEDWDALAREYHETYHAQKSKRLNPRALEAIALAEKAGARQSIVSALRQDLLERDTLAFGVRGSMEFVAGVDNLDGASKLESARRFLERLRMANAPRTRYVMIGDALHDKEVADALGVECILCGVGSHAAWRLREAGPTAADLVEAVKMAVDGKNLRE